MVTTQWENSARRFVAKLNDAKCKLRCNVNAQRLGFFRLLRVAMGPVRSSNSMLETGETMPVGWPAAQHPAPPQ